VRLRVVATPAAGRQALEAEEVDALLLLSDDRLVFRADVDAKAAAIADTAVRALRRQLPPAPELTTATLHPPDEETTDAATLVAYAGSLLLLMSLVFYGQWVVTGVIEERNNRVVELILATVRPRHLLAGKVIGIGLLGLAQLALVAGLAAVLLAAGAFDAPASLGGNLALVIPWFVLGFALYAVGYAAAGALASRQQNADTAGQPVAYTILAAYFAGYVALSVDMDGLLANLLTVFPLTAPLVLPARSALVGVPLWEHALAVVLVLGSIHALVRFAGRVYAHGLLHTGGRLDPRTAWRLARHP
jgi:ABC-2 type transport system permease protein